MILAPVSVEDLSRQIAAAQSRIAGVDLGKLNSIVEHVPADMTATVEAGMTLSELQAALSKHGQWVPLDPPNPSRVTIGDLLAHDLSGPRRRGYGTVREYVLGMRVVLGNGIVIKAGGKVVKNVAGYDLCRLFIAAKHSLGIIVEATFKLRPLPEKETFLQLRCASLPAAAQLAARLDERRLEPVAFDLHNLTDGLTMVLGFAGVREDVEYQANLARQEGFAEPDSLDYDLPLPRKTSVLPTEVFKVLGRLSSARFIARLANGIVHHDGFDHPAPAALPTKLMARVKDTYDPRHILPEYSA